MLTFVPPWIPEKPLLAIVGQSPGPVEAEQERPFVGPAGEQQRAWLRAVGLDPDEDVMWTNVHPYFHPEEPNYKPTAKESREGYERVREEIGALPSIACVLLVGGPASHMIFKGNMGQMQGRQGAIGIESAAAEDGKPAGVRSVEPKQTSDSLPRQARQSGDERPTAVSTESRNAISPSRVVSAVIGVSSVAAPSVSIPTFAMYHPSFYIRQHSFKKRAEIEGQVMDVLARVVEVIKGKAPELELPEPEYVEEVVIT